MDVIKQVSKKLKKIRKCLANSENEKLNSLYTQKKYARLFQKVILLDGGVVQQAVDDLMKDVLANTKEQFKTLFSEKDAKDQSLLDGFQKILNDQLIQIYWISVIFNQFNSFVFVGFHSLTLQQYCLKKILDSSLGRYSKRVVMEVIEALWIRKKYDEKSQRFNKDLLSIINFFSYRTFLNLLSIEKQSDNYQMEVIFNCEFSEEEATKLIKQQEKKQLEEEMFLLSSSSDEDEEEGKDKDKIDEEEEDNDNKYNSQESEIEIEEDKGKNKIKKYSKKAKNSSRYESLYNQIEEMYMERLTKESEEFISSIKEQKVSKQLKQIEEFIYQEERYISFYMNRISIKVADKLRNICVVKNYPNLVKHPQYGLAYMFQKKDISKLNALYNFVQNDSESIQVLSQEFNQIIEHKIQEADKEQEKLFKSYRDNQIEQEEVEGLEDHKKSKDIAFIQQCQEKWISQMFQIYKDMYTDGLVKAFESNPSLNACLSRAFEQQFNISETVVDYLANTCHLYLLNDKYSGEKHQDILDKPEQVLFKLFSFSSQKDQFLDIYRRQLSHRLIYQMYISEEIELKFLKYIEEIIGSTVTINNMKSMIQDLNKNVLLRLDYQTHPHPDKKKEQQKSDNINSQENKSELTKESSKIRKERSNRSNSRERSRSSSRERRRTYRDRDQQVIETDSDDEERIVQPIQVISDDDGAATRQMVNLIEDSDFGNDSQISIDDDDDDDDVIQIEDGEDNSQEEMYIKIIEQNSKAEKKASQQNGKGHLIDLENEEIEIEEEKKVDFKKESKQCTYNISQEEINIIILTNIKWPLKQTKTSSQIKLPSFLEKHYKDYSEYYLKEFQHQRKLELLHHCSYSTVAFRSDSKKQHNGIYTLQVSSYSMLILLCFNNDNQLKFSEIHSQTAIQKKTLQEKLNTLVKYKILVEDKDPENEGSQQDKKNRMYQVNTTFTNKSQEIEIDWIPQEYFYSEKILEGFRSDQGIIKNNKEVTTEITHHRKIVLNSNIIKIMKEKEHLHQDELIKQVQEKLKSNKALFNPSVNQIKDQIQDCINKIFIKYSDKEDEKNVLIYLK